MLRHMARAYASAKRMRSHTLALVSLVEAALRQMLDTSGLTAAELARRAGVSRASVSEYLHGRRQPRVGQLERLAEAADLQVEIVLAPSWRARKEQLEDVLALADALPLRPQPARTRTWAEIISR
jgi:transcriptional regulator with XRE-family HTH domain